ncbi:uncharacterized protein ACNLHF_008723 [Anomaloglossus baeobatrachus]|uniref:uncharacterized protein LOC142290285 n=1 Tax=Anomaloglossus baeobatrachus TaxID=238106 RepID=UPI003F4FDF8F
MVEFLDLRVMLENNHITTSLFRKQTATNSVLHYSSFHPRHVRDGIPKGQFLRVRRNCTDVTTFRNEAQDLTTRFIKRGYPRKVVSKAFQHSANTPRSDTFRGRLRTEMGTINLVTTYNNHWDKVRQVLTKNWNILLSEPRLTPFISAHPKLTAKRAMNLKDMLSSSHFKRPTIPLGRGHKLVGSFPCGDCTICPFLVADSCVRIGVFPGTITTKFYSNCRSRNVVYLLICECPKLYVGQTTQELRRRIQHHFSDIGRAQKDQAQGF